MKNFCTFILLILVKICSLTEYDVCLKDDTTTCGVKLETARYLLYDVNPPEGFNLRRDVYMRLAAYIHKYGNENWKMVLPPWPHLYHWRSKFLKQDQLPWNLFFDIFSLKQFAPVIEMKDFFKEVAGNSITIDAVYVLQHYEGAFKTANWSWDDKWSFEDCASSPNYEKEGGVYDGWFWGYDNITALNVKCVSFQGGASLLSDLLKQTDGRVVMLDHAEIVLHDHFGDKYYWNCRRSMKFADALIEEAKSFRRHFLNTTDNEERANGKRNLKGGPYICVHLRRRDFIEGRPNEIPSIEFAARQISEVLAAQNLTTVFIATDAPETELKQLKKLLMEFTVVHYIPVKEELTAFKDGGIAIIEQIICSFARYFVGTYESTFSFRIQEEREILGFPEETTFNRLCGSNKDCVQPSKWKIQT